MKITSLEQVSSAPMQMAGAVGVTKQVPLGSADGAPNFFSGYLPLSPAGILPTIATIRNISIM